MSTGNTALSNFQATTSSFKKMTEALKNMNKRVLSMGTAFMKASEITEQANEIIALGTGATGSKLSELVKSFEEVGSKVPSQLSEVAEVITGLSVGTGATGAQLEALAESTLNASTIMGVESPKMMTNAMAVMKNWGISVADSTGMLDKLVLSSSNSGVSITDLSTKMAEHGGSLRKLGFDFNQSLALLTRWQKEGIDAKDVIGTMDKAFAQLSKNSNIANPSKDFQELIQKIQTADSKTQALKLSSEKLGKAGRNLAESIHKGALAVDQELVKSLDTSSGTIEKQIKGTSKFKQEMGHMRNQLVLAAPALLEFAKTGVTSIGTALIDAGNKANASAKIIKAGTGATGKELNDLLNSYKAIGRQVPEDLNQVAKVFVGIRNKTGETGSDMEKFAKTTLDASRLIGVDSSELMANSTDVLKTWGLSTWNGVRMMDRLLAASQSTGVGFTDLGTKMKDQGESLRKMGFTFDQSLAMLAQWGKEGKDAKEIVGTMDKAFTALSKKKGITDPVQSFNELIQKIQSAATEKDALKLSMQGFGKAGKSMAEAIRSGSLVINNDLIKTLQSSSGAIAQQVSETMTLGEKWGIVSNQLSIALAPMGQAILNVAGKVIPYFGNAINWLAERSNVIIPGLIGMAAVIFGVLVPSLWASAVAGWAAIAPFLPIIGIAAAVGVAFAALAYAFENNFLGIRDIATFVLDLMNAHFKVFIQMLTGDFNGAWNTIKETINKIIGATSKIGEMIGLDPINFRLDVNNGTQNSATSQTAPKPDGSHYNGLDYVPYDGYVARLHKGERVMTAQENKSYTSSMCGGATSISITGNTFNVRQESDIDAIARALAREIKAAGGLMA